MPAANELDPWVTRLESLLPKQAADYQPALVEQVYQAAEAIDQWSAVVAAELHAPPHGRQPADHDAPTAGGEGPRRSAARRGFQPARRSGRRRGQQTARRGAQLPPRHFGVDRSFGPAALLAERCVERRRRPQCRSRLREPLLDLLIEFRSSVGAKALVGVLAETPQPERRRRLFGGNQQRAGNQPPGGNLEQTQAKLLHLIAISGNTGLLPQVAAFLLAGQTSPELAIAAAETIRTVGLPQDARPGGDKDLPAPAITARQVQARLAAIDASRCPHRWRLAATNSSAGARPAQQGIAEESYRLENYELRPGDWLLMRNPSPYNLFTDLSPGLFTHVGVVHVRKGHRRHPADGAGRFAGARRADAGHERRRVRAADAALRVPAASRSGGRPQDGPRRRASLIGNETRVRLEFSHRSRARADGQPLAGKKIRTYCAGLLLLCAVADRRAERRILSGSPKFRAGGHTVENLAQLGLSFGKDFISPTGALVLDQAADRRPARADVRAAREVEEAIYDHFAAVAGRPASCTLRPTCSSRCGSRWPKRRSTIRCWPRPWPRRPA